MTNWSYDVRNSIYKTTSKYVPIANGKLQLHSPDKNSKTLRLQYNNKKFDRAEQTIIYRVDDFNVRKELPPGH